jgi:hypothetical protein
LGKVEPKQLLKKVVQNLQPFGKVDPKQLLKKVIKVKPKDFAQLFLKVEEFVKQKKIKFVN